MKRSTVKPDIMEAGLVSSSQAGIHPRLDETVRKHLASHWAQPLHRPTLDAFRRLQALEVFAAGRPLILDSGCGTGESTRRLAERFPGHLVIGVDRSLKRLSKSRPGTDASPRDNCLLLRAELATFWRLMLGHGLSAERHFLFYPNPWPKAAHLARRWHGHPVFPDMLALGGEIELRCNWGVYAEEFARAASLATREACLVQTLEPESAISPFERKYLERGQTLYVVRVPARASQAFRLARPDLQAAAQDRAG